MQNDETKKKRKKEKKIVDENVCKMLQFIKYVYEKWRMDLTDRRPGNKKRRKQCEEEKRDQFRKDEKPQADSGIHGGGGNAVRAGPAV